jgi:tripartite-type tricarboxylate transporter receptor subunit TctC
MHTTMKTFSRRSLLALALLAPAVAALPAPAWAVNEWPDKPVKIVVPFPAGGGTDLVARILGQKLAGRLGQPVIIDNRPGAATVIGTDAVAKAQPDGYNLLLSGSTSFTVNPAIRARLPYDPVRDLQPIAIVARTPLVLVVGADSPWHSVAELLAAAKASPKKIRYATFGVGSAPHLEGAMFALAGGVEMQDVPYRGSSQGIVAVVGGEIEMAIDTVAVVAPHVRAGKLRPLGIVGTSRSSMLPDVPTMAELKLPDATSDAWYGLAAPANTPAAVVQKLQREVTAIMGDPAVQAQLRAQGMEPVAVDGASFRKQMTSEIARYRTLADRAGIAME